MFDNLQDFTLADLLMDSPQHGFQGDRAPAGHNPWRPNALTIAMSRESGARGGTISRRVGEQLGWQVYTQDLLEYTVQDERVRHDVLDNLPDDAREWVEQQLAQSPVWDKRHEEPMMLELVRMVLALGTTGEAVIIGRGAGHILPPQSTLHVRLVAPLAERVAYMAQWMRLTRDEAADQVRLRDQRREEYLQDCLHRSPDDVRQYDMVLNTSLLGEDLSATLIVEAARHKLACLLDAKEAGRSGHVSY